MGRVQEHDAAELGGGLGGVDGAVEALLHQGRYHAGVVDMSVGQQHAVDFPGGQRQRWVLIEINALLHAVVDENLAPRRGQQRP